MRLIKNNCEKNITAKNPIIVLRERRILWTGCSRRKASLIAWPQVFFVSMTSSSMVMFTFNQASDFIRSRAYSRGVRPLRSYMNGLAYFISRRRMMAVDLRELLCATAICSGVTPSESWMLTFGFRASKNVNASSLELKVAQWTEVLFYLSTSLMSNPCTSSR